MKCVICGKYYVILMCPELPVHKNHKQDKIGSSVPEGSSSKLIKEANSIDQALANNTSGHVFLQTLQVTISSQRGSRIVRALIDSGSQRSYILKSTAQDVGFLSKRKEKIIHCLFGGVVQEQKHDCFDVKLSYRNYSCTFKVLDQLVICKNISRKDQEKRLVWPLGRIREIIPGKDGVIRLVRVETAREQLLRPIQRSVLIRTKLWNRHRHYHRLMKIVVQDCLMSNTTLKAETVVKTTRSGQNLLRMICFKTRHYAESRFVSTRFGAQWANFMQFVCRIDFVTCIAITEAPKHFFKSSTRQCVMKNW
ncbi:hypothetical protein NQ315_017219 [Exocentrus adspersus]|uniref:DUF5641 domain-containing protein n=1 Tax=Exocentrus adspersus TaxID=1586481 RepID=A0AAV8V6W6_9CUCU|nr:hypothetical protein NQ315_017219 [Exocentrus adspersus]